MTGRIVSEIGRLLISAEAFEREIEAILARDDLKLSPSAIKSLQEIDLLSQSLQSIAFLLDAMQENMSENRSLRLSELTSHIPLRDMAARLSGAKLEDTSHNYTEF